MPSPNRYANISFSINPIGQTLVIFTQISLTIISIQIKHYFHPLSSNFYSIQSMLQGNTCISVHSNHVTYCKSKSYQAQKPVALNYKSNSQDLEFLWNHWNQKYSKHWFLVYFIITKKSDVKLHFSTRHSSKYPTLEWSLNFKVV